MRRGLCSPGAAIAAAYSARCCGLLMRRSTRGLACVWAGAFGCSILAHKAKTIARMANQVFETVRTVMAVREYDDRAIPDDVLRRIVEAAHLTASGGNQQPWHFILVRQKDRLRKLGSLVRTGGYTANAAAAVIVAYAKSSRIGASDGSRAIQDMILVAWADGVASNWTGFGNLDGVRDEFGLPDSYEVLAVVPLGYPRRKVMGRKRRKPFDEVVSAERFGTPLA